MRGRGATSLLSLLSLLCLGACDGLLVDPTPRPHEAVVQFAVSDFDPDSVGSVVAKVDRVWIELTSQGLTRDTVVPVRAGEGRAGARLALTSAEAAGPLDIRVELREGHVALFRGERTLAGASGLTVGSNILVVPVPGSVRVVATRYDFDALGDTIGLFAEVLFGNGDPIVGAPVEWSVDDTNVADVVDGGRLVPRGPGATAVHATHGGRAASRLVSVVQVATTLRGLAPADTTLFVGDTVRLRPFGVDRTGFPLLPGARLTYSAAGPVSVDSVGTVRVLGVGVGTVEGVVGVARHSVQVSAIAPPPPHSPVPGVR